MGLQQSLGTGQGLPQLPVAGARDPQRASKRLEDGFDLVMARASVEHLEVDVGPGPLGEAVEEVVDQLGLEVADPPDPKTKVHDRMHPAAQIDRRDSQGLIHGQETPSIAVNAFLVPQSLRQSLTGLGSRAELAEALAPADPDEPFPLSALRVPRGKSGGTQRVALEDTASQMLWAGESLLHFQRVVRT